MNELNMSIYTGKDGENKVTLTAAFATHEEAVAFHNGLSALCQTHSKGAKIVSAPRWTGRLLSAATNERRGC